jgi:hypothetical protein
MSILSTYKWGTPLAIFHSILGTLEKQLHPIYGPAMTAVLEQQSNLLGQQFWTVVRCHFSMQGTLGEVSMQLCWNLGPILDLSALYGKVLDYAFYLRSLKQGHTHAWSGFHATRGSREVFSTKQLLTFSFSFGLERVRFSL